MIQSTKEIEKLINDYVEKHDKLLEPLYSARPPGNTNIMSVFGTKTRMISISKNVLVKKNVLKSNKDLNKFMKHFREKIDVRYDYTAGEWRIYNYNNDELLKQNNFWKTLTTDINYRGYELEVYIVDEIKPSNSDMNDHYYEIFIGATQNKDFIEKHKGKMGARSLGLIEKRIMKFLEFLNESNSNEDTVSDILRSLSRNYESKKFFYTDHLQFVVEEERRDWRDTRKYVELEKTVTHEASYKLKFKLDDKLYLLTIKFDFDFIGSKEKDAPETASEEDIGRLNIVLDAVNLKRIELKSSDFNFSSSTFSEVLKKSATDFLIKMMAVDYDTLGAEIYSLQQK